MMFFSYSDCIGVTQGSTRMMVYDIRNLRNLKRRRGFFTRAGLGIQSFSHSDQKLRGFVGLITVHIETLG
jgi:hypothetical protein